ncbi:MAG: hypothetical protein MHPSP_003814 [Paramarteilia canceri]
MLNNTSSITFDAFLKVLKNINIDGMIGDNNPENILSCINYFEYSDEVPITVFSFEQIFGRKISSLPPVLYPGGETEAYERIDRYFESNHWYLHFMKDKLSDMHGIKKREFIISPYMSRGCLSSKYYFLRLKKTLGQSDLMNRSSLMQREYYHYMNYIEPNFLSYKNNIFSPQIAWHENRSELQQFLRVILVKIRAICNIIQGNTGFPVIDALIRQTINEGWTDNYGRVLLVNFVTTCGLYNSWEEGARFFFRYNIDFDSPVCYGCWIDYSSRYPVFENIAKLCMEHDPEGSLIRTYVTELNDYPKEYMFEPHKAPIEVQKQANCIIGIDYPMPLFDAEERVQINQNIYNDYSNESVQKSHKRNIN